MYWNGLVLPYRLGLARVHPNSRDYIRIWISCNWLENIIIRRCVVIYIRFTQPFLLLFISLFLKVTISQLFLKNPISTGMNVR